jgi:hypothetical protein
MRRYLRTKVVAGSSIFAAANELLTDLVTARGQVQVAAHFWAGSVPTGETDPAQKLYLGSLRSPSSLESSSISRWKSAAASKFL